jgi:NTP pyrophosphatase (non-canonical NTP hydrolase)
MTFEEMLELNRRVVVAFDAVEQRPWAIETVMVELAKQVGDLSRRVSRAEGYYLSDRVQRPEYVASTAAIGDELADVLYCLLRIADHYGVDLAEAHVTARSRELQYCQAEGERRTNTTPGAE